MARLWQQRRWRLLLNLIDHLPSHSHYGEAVAQDDERAEMLLSLVGDDPPDDDQAPSVQEWTPQMDIDVAIFDRLSEILTAIYAASEKKFKPVKLKPLRRPETALERARRKAKHTKYRSLAERVRVKPH